MVLVCVLPPSSCPRDAGGGFVQNKVVKKEKKEGPLHLKALKEFFEFVFVVVNAPKQQLPQQQQQQLVVENALFVFVCALFVFVCASCQVHVAEKPRSSRGRSAKRIRS